PPESGILVVAGAPVRVRRTMQNRQHLAPRARQIRHVALLDVRQSLVSPASLAGTVEAWHALLGIDVVVDGDADLLQVVQALRACRGVPDLLHGRDKKTDEDSDNGDDDQQLDQCETESPPIRERHALLPFGYEERTN